jgi:hypothetical protein
MYWAAFLGGNWFKVFFGEFLLFYLAPDITTTQLFGA